MRLCFLVFGCVQLTTVLIRGHPPLPLHIFFSLSLLSLSPLYLPPLSPLSSLFFFNCRYVNTHTNDSTCDLYSRFQALCMHDVDGGVKHLKKMVILAQEGLQKRNAELIDVVVKHPDIYVFGEFIDSPVIAKLQGGEFDDAYRLLELV